MGGLGICDQLKLIGIAQPELFHFHFDGSRRFTLERRSHFQFVRLRNLPCGIQIFPLCIFNRYLIHAHGTFRFEVQGIFPVGDERAAVLGRNRPLPRGRRTQIETWTFVRF